MNIFIPFKEQSLRFEHKNFKLFKYTYDYIFDNIWLGDNIYVITDSDIVKDFVNKQFDRGLNFIDEENDLDNRNEIIACYNAAKKLNISEFIWLPLTCPLRNKDLIENVYNELISDSYDFITSYEYVTDRSLFYIDDDFSFSDKMGKNEVYMRTGSLCKQRKMLDGAIYGIKTEFLARCVASENINDYFWNKSNFKAVLNDVDIFIDVDRIQDFNLFKAFYKNENYIID